MAGDKQITIPCKRYIRKYIEAVYGDPVRITNHSLIGIYIYALIEKKFYDSRNNDFSNSESFTEKHYNDKLTMLVSNFVFFNIGCDLSPQRALAVNRFFEEKFEDHLYMYCDAYVRNGEWRKTAIEDFAERYNIDLEIDITFDSLKQTEYRLRRKRNGPHSTPPLNSTPTLF